MVPVFDIYDVMALIGMVVLCVGVGMAMSVAAGLMVVGAVLVAVGLLGAWRKGGRV